MSNSMTNVSNNEKIVIVGMGPAGIVSAIEAAQKGHQVLLVENRDHFTRTQRVKLNKDTLKYIHSLNKKDKKTDKADKQFYLTICEEGTVQVNLLQEFLEKKLKQMFPHEVDIRKGAKHLIKDIDVENNIIQIESNGKVEHHKYSHLVGADGARHDMANKINKVLGDKIEYKALEDQTRQEPHGTISLRYNKKQGSPKIEPKYSLKWEDMPRLQALGWEESYLPACYMFHDHKKQHFYIAGEIPAKILDEKDPSKKQEMLVAWGKGILEVQFGFQNVHDDIVLDVSDKKDEKSKQEDKLKTTAFPVTLHYAETPCIEINPGHAFVLMGDASKNANFHLGHGANDAIRDGKKFGECLSKNGFDIESYKQHQQAEKGEMLTKMASIEKGMMRGYEIGLTVLNRETIKQAHILINLAHLYKDDENLTKLAVECQKAIKATPLDHDEIYLQTIKLADQLNEKAKAITAKLPTALEPTNKEYVKMNVAIAKLENKLDQLQSHRESILFKAISALISPLGKHLQQKHEKARDSIILQIDQLKEKKQELIHSKAKSQKKIAQPHSYHRHKQKLDEMIEKSKIKLGEHQKTESDRENKPKLN